ncbi:MAG: putative polymerase ECF-subfamily sigma factor [Actinomycetia bacterium]|nr:putative polymerase ECF-subfamily sigma factor [Actinomycetes bacterium]
MAFLFDEFYGAEYESVRRALVVALADDRLAEDAAQEAFADAFAHWRRVGSMDRPAGWVYIAAVRYARRRRPMLTSNDEPAADHADAVVATHDVAALLAALPPRQRLAVTLRYLADLPLEGVAEAMGCALGTAKSTLHAALRRMRVDATEAEVAVDAN